jgi:hypothetical protein
MYTPGGESYKVSAERGSVLRDLEGALREPAGIPKDIWT